MAGRKQIGLIVLGLIVVGFMGASGALADSQLECAPMGVVVTVPPAWKVNAAKDAPPSASAEDGSAKLMLLYFEKQFLFEVTGDDKVAAHFAPALKDAKIADFEKVVINGLIGAKVSGAGTLDGKPVHFKCALIGDKDNQPNTLAVIIVGSEQVMKDSAKLIETALGTVRPKSDK